MFDKSRGCRFFPVAGPKEQVLACSLLHLMKRSSVYIGMKLIGSTHIYPPGGSGGTSESGGHLI